jgi:3-dehydroquinate synthase
MKPVTGAGPCLLLSDRRVDRLYGDRVVRALNRSGFKVRRMTVPSGERSKSMAEASRVLRALARMRAGRDTPLVALGGGVVTDLGGLAAALYARGVPWIAVPTTTLGMADAAIGGKTAVDLPEGKNLVGAFHAPRMVVADIATLRTLDARHRRNGMAEVAKVDILGGVEQGLRRVSEGYGLKRGEARLNRAIARAAWRKADIVAADPFERRGKRVLLNLGHTAGHALEAVTAYDGSVLHGEGVAIGMVVAARVAVERRILSRFGLSGLVEALDGLGLPVTLPDGLTPSAVARRAGVDKKRRGGKLRMVLPRTRTPAVVREVSESELLDALRATKG